MNRRDEFPVLLPSRDPDRQTFRSLECPLFVPWPFIAEHEKQCFANHRQTPLELAARGGLDAAEMVAVVEDRKWEAMAIPVAVTTLKRHLEAWCKKTSLAASYGQTCAIASCTLPATTGPTNWLPSRCERHAQQEGDLPLPEEHARRLLECARYVRTSEETREALDAGAVQIRSLDAQAQALATAFAGYRGSPNEPLVDVALRLVEEVESWRTGCSAGFGVLTANPHKTLVDLGQAQRDHHREHHLREREAWLAVYKWHIVRWMEYGAPCHRTMLTRCAAHIMARRLRTEGRGTLGRCIVKPQDITGISIHAVFRTPRKATP